MFDRRLTAVALMSLCLATGALSGQEGPKVGPANGSLVLVGGSMSNPEILERFLELAGGPEASIVVIPTAGGGENYGPQWPGLNLFRRAGASSVTLLHTYDPSEADTKAFSQPIREAHGVWFTGGRQWRLADSYLDTQVHTALWELLDRGGVIGGSSAGATIQGSYLARGDTATNTVMMGDHQEGLAFLKDTAVDQHLLKRNRQFDLIEIIRAHPQLLGIGIDEDTALVVRGDQAEVLGSSYVAIYDYQRGIDSGGQFYFLAPGDHFDLATRQASRPTFTDQPLERVVKRSWKEKAQTAIDGSKELNH
ncbi:MAG: cyanophycinase [Deltaproteobacteria bacterium]|nr:cyanophycinase [Deltaproteobacteria bacterium]